MRIGEDQAGFMVPSHVREYLKDRGFLSLPLEAMDEWIASWDAWMASRGDFYDYKDTDGLGRQYEVHRRSIKPAMRVCQEWGSLILNDKTTISCDSLKCTKWLNDFFAKTDFMAKAQDSIVRAFGLGTGAWAL